MRDTKYDYEAIEILREQGDHTWEELAKLAEAPSANSLRSGYYQWKQRQEGAPNREGRGAGSGDPSGQAPDPAPASASATVSPTDIARITSLEDLIAFFKVDTDAWEADRYRINKWETAAFDKVAQDWDVMPLYQVRADLIRSRARTEAILQEITDAMIADAEAHAPAYEPVPRPSDFAEGNPVLAEVAIHDPHFGLKAFGAELTGISQDLKIVEEDYSAAVDHLLGLAQVYNTERILYIVGHDSLHVDAPGADGRVGGQTTRGTPQDTDTRLGKMYTAFRRAAVRGIDKARLIAPVDVRIVPGNHDRIAMYHMAETLAAWYRNDPEVDVLVTPKIRQFYRYGANTFMLTHGEEALRKRDNLAQIFPDECPPELWVSSDHRVGGYREIHTGHLHKKIRGGYYPTAEMEESRGIRLRGLPALTAGDAWHHESGYRHQRAATLLAYRRSGGCAGEHEFTL